MSAFYLKYRPQKIKDLDITSVRQSLEKIIEKKTISHAFLFSGPKGTGKTSAARLLAKAVNCLNPDESGEPCNICTQCVSVTKGTNIDVIEMDAASHRGIDDIRSLREAVGLAPVAADKKVYIIDEAHMLTTEASNALLKTLEEPPEHVIFILATTNPEKLIGTIRSRATNVVFTKASTDELVKSLKKIAVGEKKKVDDRVLEKIALTAGGSFRDAHKLLEQLITLEVDLDDNKELDKYLFSSEGYAAAIIQALAERNSKDALEQIQKCVSEGVSIKVILEEILTYIHDELLARYDLQSKDSQKEFKKLDTEDLLRLSELMEKTYKNLHGSYLEHLPLITATIKWCDEVKKLQKPPIESDETKSRSNGNGHNKTVKSDAVKKNQSSPTERATLDKTLEISDGGVSEDVWRKILLAIRPVNASIEALLRAVQPLSFDGERLEMGVYYSFHKERLEDINNRRILEDTISVVTGKPVKVVCRLTSPPKDILNDSTIDPTIKEEVVLEESRDGSVVNIAKDVFGS